MKVRSRFGLLKFFARVWYFGWNEEDERVFDTAMGNSFGWGKQVVHPLEPETRKTSFRVKIRMPADRFKELVRRSKDGSELGSLILMECMEGESRCSIIPCFSSEQDLQPFSSMAVQL